MLHLLPGGFVHTTKQLLQCFREMRAWPFRSPDSGRSCVDALQVVQGPGLQGRCLAQGLHATSADGVEGTISPTDKKKKKIIQVQTCRKPYESDQPKILGRGQEQDLNEQRKCCWSGSFAAYFIQPAQRGRCRNVTRNLLLVG